MLESSETRAALGKYHRTRLFMRIVRATALAIFLLIASIVEISNYSSSSDAVLSAMQAQAKSVSTNISELLATLDSQLSILGSTLTNEGFPTNSPLAPTIRTFDQFTNQNSDIATAMVLDATGSRPMWVSSVTDTTLLRAQNISNIGGGGPFGVGDPIYDRALKMWIAPVNFVELQGSTPLFQIRLGLKIDPIMRSLSLDHGSALGLYSAGGSLFGVVSNGKVSHTNYLDTRSAIEIYSSSTIESTPDVPWKVVIAWRSNEVATDYLNNAPLRWSFELTALALILLGIERVLREFQKSSVDVSVRDAERRIYDLSLLDITDRSALLHSVAQIILYTTGVESIRLIRRNGDGNYVTQTRFFRDRRAQLKAQRADRIETIISQLLKDPNSTKSRSVVRVSRRQRVTVALDSFYDGDEPDAQYFIAISTSNRNFPRNFTSSAVSTFAASINFALAAYRSTDKERRARFLYHALASESESVLGAISEEELLRDTCLRLSDGSGFSSVWISRSTGEGKFSILAGATWGNERQKAIRNLISGTKIEKSITTTAHDGRVHFDNYRRDSDGRLEETTSPSIIHLPIETKGAIYGVLSIIATDSNAFDGETVSLCRRISRLIGRGLDEITVREELDLALTREVKLARRDQLTGLANRLALEEQLNIRFARTSKFTSTLLGIFDLDDFKWINDSFGHAVGDSIISQFANRVKNQIGESGFVARIGGDEFVVILDNVNDEDAMFKLLDQIGVALSEPYEIGEWKIPLGSSMGYSIAPVDGTDPIVLLKQADQALYRSKVQKRTRQSWYLRWSSDFDSNDSTRPLIDPYSEEATRVLTEFKGQIAEAVSLASSSVVNEVRNGLEYQNIAETLLESDRNSIEQLVVSQLELIADADTQYIDIKHAAEELGVHLCLIGVLPSMVNQATQQIGQILDIAIRKSTLSADEADDVISIVNRRLADSYNAQVVAHETTIRSFSHASIKALPGTLVSWTSTISREIDQLVHLPGIAGLALLVPDATGRLKVLYQVSSPTIHSENIFEEVVDDPRNTEISLVSTSWNLGRVERCANCQLRSEPLTTYGDLKGKNVRALASIPVLDERGNSIGAILITSTVPNVFDTDWGRQLTDNLSNKARLIYQQSINFDDHLALDERTRLRRAFNNGGIVPYYQPIVNLESQEVEKVEVLGRLLLDDGVVVTPDRFLPLLSANDLATLLRETYAISLTHFKEWDKAGLSLGLSLNLPPILLNDEELVKWLVSYTEERNVEPHRITFEILESEEFTDIKLRDTSLYALRDFGFHIVMDDFGTGFSNIIRLRELPFDGFKIDQSLVRNVVKEPKKVIEFIGISTIIGRDLNLDVEVEGLESQELIEAATRLGAKRGQGYAISRPLNAADFSNWMKERKRHGVSDDVESLLGALAHHWNQIHINPAISATDQRAYCPIDSLAEREEYARSRFGRLHKDLHSSMKDGDSRKAFLVSQELADELAELIRTNGIDA